MSSEAFKGYSESMAASERQDYNRSHFSKKDIKDLKQEYEDFFAVEEKPPDTQPAPDENAEPGAQNEETKQKSKDFVSFDDF